MKTTRTLIAMLKADFLERTRRSSFLVALCLVIYLGYAVNTGQVLILLGAYRGIYNSAWVGSLMALVITFFLGVFGFYLVKDTIQRDERSGVGQIIATTALTRPQYLLGKWLSNFAVLATLVITLAIAAVLMQVLQREAEQIEAWALVAPLLLVALPMMALVAAFAASFETVRWLRGGFGNLVYFGLFICLFYLGAQLDQAPWLDVTGISLIGANMKAAAGAAFPDYDGRLMLGMMSAKPLGTFLYSGLNWTAGLALQRLAWLGVSAGVVLVSALFFNRFDPAKGAGGKKKGRAHLTENAALEEETAGQPGDLKAASLTPLAGTRRFQMNFLRLAWLELMLLVKGLKWYWLAGMAGLWIGSACYPSEHLRSYWFMLVAIWPVLVWSKMGQRDAQYRTEGLIYHAAYPTLRLVAAAWCAGVLITALAASGVLVGRILYAEPVGLLPWALAVIFIPTLALGLGACSRTSKVFEVVYPILWYLGPFNPQNQLTVLDYLGVHSQAPVITSPLAFAGFTFLLLLGAFLGRRLQKIA